MSVEIVADVIGGAAYRKVTWRQGTQRALAAQFAMVRVRVVTGRDVRGEEQWLVIEQPKRAERAEHYVLATLPKSISRKELVRRIKQRWRTERAYEDLKGELGLDHFEGRTYTGWQHHVTCALTCYAFLVAERARVFPPTAGRDGRDDAVDCAA
jgi:SRSO17 transposase